MTETQTSNTSSGRFVWLDSLRLTAGVSMVGLHSTADPQGQPFALYEPVERIFPMVLRAVIYTARTELFLIISLFLLLMALDRRPKTYRETILLQARRLLLPFLFWTVFYGFYNLIKASAFGYFGTAFSDLGAPKEWVGFLLLGTMKYHMHFIPTLFGLILMYPMFRLAVTYPILGAGVLVCLLIKRDLDGFVYQHFWDMDMLPYLARGIKIATYAGYGLMAGAFLGIWQRSTPQTRVQFVPLGLFLGGLLFVIKLVASWKTIETGHWPFGYTAGYWADFLMPVLLFGLALSLGHKQWPRILSKLAPYSFGIYLCHPIFLDLAEIILHGQDVSPSVQVLFKIAFALAMTSGFVWGVKRTPLLAWTIGLGPLPKLFPIQTQL